MYLYRDPAGSPMRRAAWDAKKASPDGDWVHKQYSNGKIKLQVEWIGRYQKKLPEEYRKHYAVAVYNRLVVRKSELEDESLTLDKGFVPDKMAYQEFITLEQAEAYYDELLVEYTNSYMDYDEETEQLTLVEVDNQLAPKKVGSIDLDDDLVEAAKEHSIDLGGWS